MSKQKIRKNRRRLIRLLLYELIFIILLLELASRIFWSIKYDVPFVQTDKIIYAFYPALKTVQEESIEREKASFDILLLGGSVLNKNWTTIQRILSEKLTYTTKRNVLIHNLAERANTSLDSYIKYKSLSDKHFDLVVFYHGINETRANNIPDSLFKDDYSHIEWYRHIYALERYRPITKYFSLPYTLNFLTIKLSDKLGLSDCISTALPKQSWLKYGSSIKITKSFEKNLMSIIDISSRRDEQLLLMTFAYYIPDNYELAKFKAGSLDYTLHLSPIEIWGTPENVKKGIDAHNLIIRQVSQYNENVYFVDQNNLLPKNGEDFNDVCHLTNKGSEIFVNNIAGFIISLINNTDNSQ